MPTTLMKLSGHKRSWRSDRRPGTIGVENACPSQQSLILYLPPTSEDVCRTETVRGTIMAVHAGGQFRRRGRPAGDAAAELQRDDSAVSGDPGALARCVFPGIAGGGRICHLGRPQNSRTGTVRILSEAGGTLSLENPFGEDGYSLTGAQQGSVNTQGQDLLLNMRPGQTVTFSRK